MSGLVRVGGRRASRQATQALTSLGSLGSRGSLSSTSFGRLLPCCTHAVASSSPSRLLNTASPRAAPAPKASGRGGGGGAAQVDKLVATLRPHVYIHLARAQHALQETAEPGYRRSWASESQVDSALKSVIREAWGKATPTQTDDSLLIVEQAVKRLGMSDYYMPSKEDTDKSETRRLDKNYVNQLYQEIVESGPAANMTVGESKDEKTRLFREQLELETETLSDAVNKYRTLSYEMAHRGNGSAMKPVERLLTAWYRPMHDTLEAMKAESEAGPKGGKGGPKGVPVEAAYTFMQLGPAELTCITLHELTSMLLKQPAGIFYTRSCKIVGKAVEAEYNLALLRANKTVWKDLTRKHKGKDLKEWVINKTARDIGEDGLWEESMVVKVGAWLLDTCIECAVIPPDPKETKEEQEQAVTVMALKKDRVTQKAKKGKGLVNPYIVLCNERVFQVLDSSQTMAEGLFTTHQPMISEPRKWTRSDIGGYLSLKTEVIRTRSRKHMSLVNYADMTQVYDSLNYLGSIPWRINPRVLSVVEALWSAGGGKAGLVPMHDKPLPDPPSMDLTGEEFEEAKKVYNRDMRRVKKDNSELHSIRCDTEYKIDVARKFSNRKVFFPANIDFRGRVYPLPPHLNHQGADLSRGLLQFYEGRPLGPNGLRWLKIHMANVSGKDKLPFHARVQWTDDHMDQIRAVVLDPTGQQGEEGLWWLNAEEPLQALATCYEITQALASDNVELFSSHLPVHMDGSCNGLQHYGALGRDKGGGSAVNLMPHDSPQDVYAGVLEIVKQKIEVDAAAGHELAPLLRGNVTRKVVKQTVMTSVYGVTLVGAKAQILSRLQELECEWPEPREKILHDCSLYLAKLALSSLGVLFKSAQEIMAWLAELCRLVTKQGQHMSWITPLGLPVIQPYVKEKDYQVKTLKHRLTIADARVLPVSSQRQKSAFPPNFVHSLDATHMFMTTLDCKEKGLHFSSVHDSYWTHAGTMETMNASLREQFVDLYSQPILEDLLALLEMRFPLLDFPPVPQRGELDLELVKKSEYFFA